MPPSVKIESKAWDDPRFSVLGKRLGIDRDLALIRLARVWAYQTEENTETVTAELFDAIAGIEGFAAAARTAGLAAEVTPGTFRPKGTGDPGRIDWLDLRRSKARAGGIARTAAARRDPAGRLLASQQDELPGVVQPGPANPPAGPPGVSSATTLTLTLKDQKNYVGGDLAERLRDYLLRQQPRHQLGDEAGWQRRRPAWTKAMAAIASHRGSAEVVELLGWVFGDQGGNEYRFRVDSPTALAEKWDRIEATMRAPPRGRRREARIDEDWGRGKEQR